MGLAVGDLFLLLAAIFFLIFIQTVFVYSFLSVLNHEDRGGWIHSSSISSRSSKSDLRKTDPSTPLKGIKDTVVDQEISESKNEVEIPKIVKKIKNEAEVQKLTKRLEDPSLVLVTDNSTISDIHSDLMKTSRKLDLANLDIYKWVGWFISQTEEYTSGKISDPTFLNILNNYSEKMEELNSSQDE